MLRFLTSITASTYKECQFKVMNIHEGLFTCRNTEIFLMVVSKGK